MLKNRISLNSLLSFKSPKVGKANFRKGFFFVIASLIILTYIMANLALWSKSIAVYEERYSENFKISNIDYAASQVTKEQMTEFSKIAVDFALFKLNHYSIENPLTDGTDWVYGNINASVFQLITEGKADDAYFSTGAGFEYSPENKSSYTFIAFFEKMNESFHTIEMEISAPELRNFYFNQSSINTINISFDLSFKVNDIRGDYASIEKNMHISFNHSIEGTLDPAIAREMNTNAYGNQEQIEKQIFMRLYNDDSTTFNPLLDLKVERKGGSLGQGWFYGNVVQTGSEPDDSVKFTYALMGSLIDIIQTEDHEAYGAYIVTGTDDFAEVRSSLGKNKPIFLGGLEHLSSCPPLLGKGATDNCILFVSEYDPEDGALDNLESVTPSADAYDIEKFRNFIICGYYFPTINTPYDAPSYFDKLLVNSYGRDHPYPEYGIATFLVWKGIEGDGSRHSEYDSSRLDVEFFEGTYGGKIRGMPGCKSRVMCSADDSYVGQFRLSSTAFDSFLGDEAYHVGCEGTWAECDDQ